MYEPRSILVTFDEENLYLTIGSEMRSLDWSVLKNRMENGDPEALIQNIAISLVVSGVDFSDKAAVADFISGRQYRI